MADTQTLSYWEPFIMGKRFSGICKKKAVLDTGMLEDFMTCVESDSIATQFFNSYDVYTDFFDTMVDFKKMFPKDNWQELFYGAKLGGDVYRAIPSFCVFMIKRAYEAVYQIPNLIMKVLPMSCINMFTQEGYLIKGCTLCTVIQNVCTPYYNPLSDKRLKNKANGFTEIYIKSTDMVAAVPNDIGDILQEDGINDITIGAYGLESRGVVLRTMCGRNGVCGSTYDLRGLL